VKYVYDCVKPSFARCSITRGRVNASARKITSGWPTWTSAINHSQNRNGFVWGLSTRKIVTPWSIQKSTMALQASHNDRHCALAKSRG
jgi:hypothetical protein